MRNIALDGPAGAGKSTVAKIIAERLNILHLDTGAMYRAAALKAIREGISIADEAGVLKMLETTVISVENINGVQHTYLDGEDVNGLIRTEQVSKGASDIGVIPGVRIELVKTQRKFAAENDVVLDGREIGSFVLPDTPYKFFITADPLVRAKRRLNELHSKGEAMDKTLDEMTSEIIARDETDSKRAFAPLIKTDDAILIDTTHIDAQTAAEKIIAIIEKRG